MKRAREEAGVSQEELAFQADLNRTTISLYERGRREAGVDAVIKMAAALGKTPNDLCAGIEWLPGDQRFTVEKPR